MPEPRDRARRQSFENAGNVRVLFDGIAAPLLFLSGNQVNAVVP
ncbi:MAG: hypothetical protein DMG58_36530, partial [Acidobacteria bacterium]